MWNHVKADCSSHVLVSTREHITFFKPKTWLSLLSSFVQASFAEQTSPLMLSLFSSLSRRFVCGAFIQVRLVWPRASNSSLDAVIGQLLCAKLVSSFLMQLLGWHGHVPVCMVQNLEAKQLQISLAVWRTNKLPGHSTAELVGTPVIFQCWFQTSHVQRLQSYSRGLASS